ncbi:uncharacterized protein [Diadema antillarum]|uniref:uncharacterized protein n=1 Tax=Diadema antillarum TaxID=105358 RepID=UPI003A86C65C
MSRPKTPDIAKMANTVPRFDEEDVDSFFFSFERIARNLEWEKKYWSMIVQQKLTGKAHSVVSALSDEEANDYDTVKEAVLLAYQLVPEAYRQKFRGYRRGGRVSVLPVVSEVPVYEQETEKLVDEFPEVFPTCAITRFRASEAERERKESESEISLVDTFFGKVTREDEREQSWEEGVFSQPALIKAQMEDEELLKLREGALTVDEAKGVPECFYVKSGVLMRKWRPPDRPADEDWTVVDQTVVPPPYRKEILRLAHEIPMAGHMGVKKTLCRIRAHFFWPKMRKDVSEFCRTCHECQVVGKPQHAIRPAPLIPIPAFEEPFSRVMVDCVGPLPKSKSGCQYLLTVMDVSTRYAEAFPLRSITAKSVLDALLTFFTRYGLPKEIQSDQGSNFMSRVFQELMYQLGIQQIKSSAYHPQSQGALERYHQTLKTMLKVYCQDNPSDWDKGDALKAKFSGPYVVERKLGKETYVVSMPDRRKTKRVCHFNMLKKYHERVEDVGAIVSPDSQRVSFKSGMIPRVENSKALENPELLLSHLSDSERQDVVDIFQEFPEQYVGGACCSSSRAVPEVVTCRTRGEFGQMQVWKSLCDLPRSQGRPRKRRTTRCQGPSHVVDFPVPASKRELQRFLGTCGFYRRFVPNFSHLVVPLTDLLKKGTTFQLSASCQDAFQKLKAVLMNDPVLIAPNFERSFQLATDASDRGVGAVLLQDDDNGHSKPVCFFSKKLNRHQQKYSTVEKECLSVVLAVQHFEAYLNGGRDIVVYTDHKPLIFLERFKHKNQRLFRWSLILQLYPLRIVHIAGKDNKLADALSRV